MKFTLKDMLARQREQERQELLDEGVDANAILDVIEKLTPQQLRALIVKLASSNPSMVSTIKNLARS